MDRLQQLSVFRRVVETGNITRAARDLGMSQPSVSRVVGELEQRLGVPLLLRSPRGLAPTEAGQGFYSDAVRILEEVDEAEAKVLGNQRILSGTLRLACAPDLFNRVVADWVTGFLAEHPEVSLDAHLDTRPVDLVEAGLDLGIRAGPLREQSLIARKLGRIELALFASPRYIAQAGMPDHPAELERHQVCVAMVSTNPGTLSLEGPDGTVETVAVTGRFRSTSVEATRPAVEAGLGIGLLAPWGVTPQVAAGQLVPVLPGWRTEPRDVHAVWPAARSLPRRLRAFLDHVVQCAAADSRLKAR